MKKTIMLISGLLATGIANAQLSEKNITNHPMQVWIKGYTTDHLYSHLGDDNLAIQLGVKAFANKYLYGTVSGSYIKSDNYRLKVTGGARIKAGKWFAFYVDAGGKLELNKTNHIKTYEGKFIYDGGMILNLNKRAYTYLEIDNPFNLHNESYEAGVGFKVSKDIGISAGYNWDQVDNGNGLNATLSYNFT